MTAKQYVPNGNAIYIILTLCDSCLYTESYKLMTKHIGFSGRLAQSHAYSQQLLLRGTYHCVPHKNHLCALNRISHAITKTSEIVKFNFYSLVSCILTAVAERDIFKSVSQIPKHNEVNI
jgi:hypothetical protein